MRNLSQKPLFVYLITFFLTCICFLELLGQTTCGIDNSCFKISAPSSFKCIDGDFTIEQLYTNDNPTGAPILFDPATAQNSPQDVVINGSVTINVDYTFFGVSELVFTSGSELIIGSGATLTLSNSFLYGCNDVWNGITVRPGGIIRISNCRIEDALIGINIPSDDPILPKPGISAVDNVFFGNQVGIRLGTTFSNLNYWTINILSGGISGNIFDGSTDPPGYDNEAGIASYGVSHITIGDAAHSSPNQFVGYKANAYGIYLENTSSTIVNSRFYNTDASSSGNFYGVYARYFDSSRKLVLRGLGNDDTSLNTFENIRTPIFISLYRPLR